MFAESPGSLASLPEREQLVSPGSDYIEYLSNASLSPMCMLSPLGYLLHLPQG